MSTAKFFIRQAGEENEALSAQEVAQIQARDYRRLEAMVDYCKSTSCLRGHILDYFGQPHAPHLRHCGPAGGSLSGRISPARLR